MADEDRMHALRVTPCCLRAAYSVDSLKGYIPVLLEDPGYLSEIAREQSEKMAPCRCSQCNPGGCARIIRLLPSTQAKDFDNLMNTSPTHTEDDSCFKIQKKASKRKFSADIPLVCKKDDPIRLSIPKIDLAVILIGNFELLFRKTYPTGSHMSPETLFDREDSWQIVKNYEAIHNGVFLREILGGETLPAQFAMIHECVDMWMRSPVYLKHQAELEEETIRYEQEILDMDLIEEQHREQKKLKEVEREKKKAVIAERKRIRLEKELEKQREKELKMKLRQQDFESKMKSLHHTCELEPCSKTIALSRM
ncbi:hypothetical protein DFH28DRAFT_894493 [Melampsora americana]|nr:hypothetical protein DFH28DRAFT_894493 [Melampsora americana]